MKIAAKIIAVALAAMGFVGGVQAESSIVTGAGALNASASVDISVVIPKYLALQVGTGTIMTNGTTVDGITFTVPSANVGDSSVISGVGGDLTLGKVTAIVRGNSGDVTLTSNKGVGAAMDNGVATETIPYTEITTTPSALATYGTTLAAPTLGAASTVTAAAVSKIVMQGAQWTYTYKNTTVPPPGTYGGSVAKLGRVTYTANLP